MCVRVCVCNLSSCCVEPTNSGVSHRSAKLVYILCGALLCMRLEVCNIFQLCFTALKAAQINCPNARNGVRAHVSVCVCVLVRESEACRCHKKMPEFSIGFAREARQHLCHLFIVVGVSHTPASRSVCYYVCVCVCVLVNNHCEDTCHFMSIILTANKRKYAARSQL